MRVIPVEFARDFSRIYEQILQNLRVISEACFWADEQRVTSSRARNINKV